MRKAISILCTGEPGEAARELAAKHRVDLDVIPFTEVYFRNSDELRKRVAALATANVTGVVTSRNGLKGILNLMPKVNEEWNFFCLGDYSEEFENQSYRLMNIEAVWAKVSGADELADVVIEANVKKIVFFCGDQRMDILPRKLEKAGIEVDEMIVYDTVAAPTRLSCTYNGILFYSPAVVRSFFQLNKMDAESVAFAIGKSTAAELERQGVKDVRIASRPDKAELLRIAVNYLVK